jgi:putative membrane protein
VKTMQLMKGFRVFTILTGTALAAGQIAAQAPNQGQQPATSSPYPSASDGLPGGSTNAKTGSVGDTMGDAQSRQMDKRFLNQVTQGSMLNVAMGKLAAEKSSNDAVKQFAQKMATDHERGLEFFKRVAAKDGVTVSDTLDSQHKERLDKLAKLSGPDFDRAYVKDQLKAHQRMVSYFESEADNGTETAAKKMATNMLPAVQKHLDEAKELNKSLSTVAAKH